MHNTARMAALQIDLERQRTELALYTRGDEAEHESSDEWKRELRRVRSAGTVAAATPARGKRRAARTLVNPRKGNGGPVA